MGLRNRACGIRMLATVLVALAASFGAASTASAQELDVSTQPALYPAFDHVDHRLRGALHSRHPGRRYAWPHRPGPPRTSTARARVPGHFTTAVNLTPGQGFRIVATSGPAARRTTYAACPPTSRPGRSSAQASPRPSGTWSRHSRGPTSHRCRRACRRTTPRSSMATAFRSGGSRETHLTQLLDFRLFSNGNVGWAYSAPFANDEHRLDGSLVTHC